MSTRNPSKFNFTNALNLHLAENDTFRKLFEAVGKVADDVVQEKINQLARIRDPRIVHRGDYIDTPKGRGVVTYVRRVEEPELIDEVHVDVPNVGSVVVDMRSLQDRSILIRGARLSGFDYFSDTLSDDDYARVQQFVQEYWPLQSGDTFVKFMGYINRIYLDMHTLWSEDLGEVEFDPENPETDPLDYYSILEAFDPNIHTPVWEGGNHFPTSHVELEYDALSVPSPQEKVAHLVSLFYYLAPIHLVLERIVGTIDAEVQYSYIAVPDIFMSNSGYLNLDEIMKGAVLELESNIQADSQIISEQGFAFDLESDITSNSYFEVTVPAMYELESSIDSTSVFSSDIDILLSLESFIEGGSSIESDATIDVGVGIAFKANLISGEYTVSGVGVDFDDAFSYSRTGPALAIMSNGIWHTYAENEIRLNDVGLVLETESTNHVLHTSPSAIPSNGWDGFNNTGVSRSVVATGTEFGLPYVDIRWWTPTTASSTGTNLRFATTTQITVAQGEVWTESIFARLVAGSISNLSLMRLIMTENTDAGAIVGSTHFQSPSMTQIGLDSTIRRYSMTVTMDRGVTAVRARPGLEFTYTPGAIFDFTIRIYCAQMEKSAIASSPIPTTGSIATRSADVLTAHLPSGSDKDLVFIHSDDSTSTDIYVPGGDYVIDPSVLTNNLVTKVDWWNLHLARTVQPDFFGVQVRRPLSSQAGFIPNHFELGYGIIRPADLPSPGVGWSAISVGDWSVLDSLVTFCKSNGLKLWYEIGGGFGGVVPDSTLWENTAISFATRYEDDILDGHIKLGLGNEWNNVGDDDPNIFWPGTREESFIYQKAWVDAVKSVIPSAQFSSNSTSAPGYDYLEDFLLNDGANYVSSIGFHPYVQPSEPEHMMPLIRKYQKVMSDNGASSMPLMATENGWHAWYDNGVQKNGQWIPNPGTDVQLPDDMAASYIVRAHLVALLMNLRMYVHWGPDEFSFSQLDLLDRTNTANLDPAGEAYQYMVNTLKGTRLGAYRKDGLFYIEFLESDQIGKGRVYWRQDGKSGVVDLSGFTSGTDVYGDPITLTSSYNVTSSPIYVFY